MSVSYPWYQSVLDSEIEQGEFFQDCLVPVTPKLIVNVAGSTSTDAPGEAEVLDVVVLTQSCDLLGGQTMVMVCPVFPLERWLENLPKKTPARDWKNKLKNGQLIAYHVLDRCDLTDLECQHLGVDFSSAFSVGVSYLHELTSRGPRRRLMPPYREHLAQAFARYYMRIGLPVAMSPLP